MNTVIEVGSKVRNGLVLLETRFHTGRSSALVRGRSQRLSTRQRKKSQFVLVRTSLEDFPEFCLSELIWSPRKLVGPANDNRVKKLEECRLSLSVDGP